MNIGKNPVALDWFEQRVVWWARKCYQNLDACNDTEVLMVLATPEMRSALLRRPKMPESASSHVLAAAQFYKAITTQQPKVPRPVDMALALLLADQYQTNKFSAENLIFLSETFGANLPKYLKSKTVKWVSVPKDEVDTVQKTTQHLSELQAVNLAAAPPRQIPPSPLLEQYSHMMPTVRDTIRAITARVGVVVIRTTDETAITEALVQGLTHNGHLVTEWSDVLGQRTTDLNLATDRPYRADKWDGSSAGDLTGVLTGWIGNLLDEAYHCTYCTTCQTVINIDTADTKGAEDIIKKIANQRAKTCKKHGCVDSQPRPADRTLIIRGAGHLIEPEGRFYDPTVSRAMWDIAQLNYIYRSNLVILVPLGARVPENLLQHGKLIDDDLPSRTEIIEHIWPEFLGQAIEGNPLHKATLADVELWETGTDDEGQPCERPVILTATLVADRLTGLSRPEVGLALKQALIKAREVFASEQEGWPTFLTTLSEVKAAGIKKSQALEILPPVNPADVGGMAILRHWMETRRRAFTPEAKAEGIPTPRGFLMLGPPGSGKSLCAKAAAAVLGFPLLKFDIGAVFGGLVGQSESQIRQALAVVDAAAPCVLLIDEIDKGMGGAGGTSTDGGTTQRVFGTFLTWMQERDDANPVFVVASANDVRRIPPEMLRKGRFDEIFFVDLPNSDERRQILCIHMDKANKAAGKPVCTLSEQEWPAILAATEGFVGAELEQAVKEARINAFSAGEPFSTMCLMSAIADTKPLSKTMAEVIQEVRNWAQDRARRASPIASTVQAAVVAAVPPQPTPDTVGGLKFGNLS